jgi:hypothetical protein
MAGTTLQELAVKISGDIGDLKASMAESVSVTKDSAQKMSESIEKFSQESQGHLLSFQNILGIALGHFSGEVLVEGLHKIAETLKELFVDTIKEDIHAAEEHEAAVNRLATSLKVAGNFTTETAEKLQEFSEKIQASTVYTNEAVLNAEAYIESLTRLKGQGLEKATEASVNLASVLKIDLQSAAQLVTRAIEGHATALTRMGIQVQEGKTKTENLNNVLNALARFQGAATAETNTFAGSIEILKNQQDEMRVATGSVIVENTTLVAVIKEVATIFGEHAEEIAKNKEEYKRLVGEGIILAIQALQGLASALDFVMKNAKAAFEAVMFPVKEFTAAIAAAGLVAKGEFSEAMKLMKESAVENIQQIGKSFNEDTKFGEMSALLERIGSAAQKGFDSAGKSAKDASGNFKGASQAIRELTQEEIKLGQEGEKLAKQLLEKDDPQRKYQDELKSLKAANAQKLLATSDYLKAQGIANKNYQDTLTSQREQEIRDLVDKNKYLAEDTEATHVQEIAENQTKIDALMAQEDKHSVEYLKLKNQEQKNEATINKNRLDAAKDTFDQLAQFQNAKTKEIAAIAKAAAIASTVISTYEGAQKASSAMAGIPIVGPGLAIAAAAAFIGAGLARVAMISGVQLAGGSDSVQGPGFGDTVPAMLTPGERVVPKQTNQDLTAFLNQNRKSDSGLKQLGAKLDKLTQAVMDSPVQISIGGKTIVDVVRQELRGGRLLNV